MKNQNRVNFVILIVLPVVLTILLNVQPVNRSFQQALTSSRIEESSGNRQAAITYLIKALEYSPNRIELQEHLAHLHLLCGQFDEALAVYLKIEPFNQLSPQAFYDLGMIYFQMGNDRLALHYWERLRASGQYPIGVIERMISAYQKVGDIPKALDLARLWLSIEPQSAEVYYHLGILMALSEPAKALDLLIEASVLDAGYTSRVEILRKAINTALLDKDVAYQWLMIGRAMGILERWDLARILFEKSIQASPNYAEAWAFLGEARQNLRLGGWEELKKAAELNPESPLVKALLALYWRRQGRPQVALVYLHSVAELEPDRSVWLVEIGNTLAEMGDLNTALVYFQRAVQREPGIAQYWQALANYCLVHNIEIRGIGLPAARQAVLLSPDDAAALDMMGQVMIALEDFDGAERFLHRALQAAPDMQRVYLHLAQLYIRTQNYTLARENLNKVLQSNPSTLEWQVARRLQERYFPGIR
ncbi:MAG TPA: tetratricopeptide repeat protein [Anaerolineaceae bacterium]